VAISTDDIREPLAFLAGDRCEGRRPGTAGSRAAIEYLSARLREAGLSPELQKVPLVSTRTRVVRAPQVNGVRLALGEDALIAGGLTPHISVDAEVVFAGYGADLRATRGKVALILDGEPGPTRTDSGRTAHKLEEAARSGAVLALVVHDETSGIPWDLMRTRYGAELLESPSAPRVPWLLVRREAAQRLFGDLAHPRPLGVHFSVEISAELARVETANVLAVLRGHELPQEFVVYTAHHDHFGRDGEHVFHGAIDNAGGVASLLAIARAMARGPRPRRSVLFAFTTAEEFGLAGSQFLVEHPPGRIVAGINLDGLSVGGATRDVTAVGFGRSSLDPLLVALAAQQGRTVHGEFAPERGQYFRNDGYMLARAGIPVVYLNAGTDVIGRPPGWGATEVARFRHERYHRPEDRYDPAWDLTAARDNAQLELMLGAKLADR
jgi:hypothetical protein